MKGACPAQAGKKPNAGLAIEDTADYAAAMPATAFCVLFVAVALTGSSACKGKAASGGDEPGSLTAAAPAAAGDTRRAGPTPAVSLTVELRGLPDGFDDAPLRAAVDAMRPRLSRCYVGRMAARPGLSGTDVFDVSQKGAGLVGQVATTEMKDAPITRCLLARIQELEVASPPDAFQLAVTFTPRDATTP